MKNLIFIILKTILLLISLALLELNKNSVFGMLGAILLFAAYVWLSKAYAKGLLRSFLFLAAYLAVFALIFFLSWPPVRNVPAVSNRDPKATKIYETVYGKIQGVYNKEESVEVFAGIPYAKAPVNELRWKEPQKPDHWDDVLIADHFAPMSMQETNLPIYDSLARIVGYHDYKITLSDNYVEPVSEDSLYLNIWKPADLDKKVPVLVYIHGGSLQNGQPWSRDYNGENLSKEGIVFVTITYRLGIFGFYGDEQLYAESGNKTTGNYGFLDMIEALKWVKENIGIFGGDEDNITIAGESAGAAAVSALCTSPLAEGLFDRVILESSTVASKIPPHSYRSFEEMFQSSKKLKERYGVNDISQLRAMDAKDLVKEASSQHHITVDGYALTEDPYQSYKKGLHNEKAILHGFNSEESAPFLLFYRTTLKNYEQNIRYYFGDYTNEVMDIFDAKTDEEAAKYWAQIYGDVFFTYPHHCLNRLAVENDIPVYEYFFSKHNGYLGPWHSGEEIYAYDNIPKDSKLFDDNDRYLSHVMSSYWLNFTKNGDPNGSDLPKWPINTDNKSLLQLDEQINITDLRSQKLYDIMDRMYGYE